MELVELAERAQDTVNVLRSRGVMLADFFCRRELLGSGVGVVSKAVSSGIIGRVDWGVLQCL